MEHNSADWTGIGEPKKMVEPPKEPSTSFVRPFAVAIFICAMIAYVCMLVAPYR